MSRAWILAGAALAALLVAGCYVPFNDRGAGVPPSVEATAGFEPLPGTIPSGSRGAAAVYDGSRHLVYLFGGADDLDSASADILAFDPQDGHTQIVGSLPAGRLDMGIAWDGSTAYLLGGHSRSVAATLTDEILAWDSRDGGAARVVGHMPAPIFGGVAAWTGSKVVYAGGQLSGAGDRMSDSILTWTPPEGDATVVGTMSTPLEYTSRVWADGALYIFGGFRDKPGRTNDLTGHIYRVTLDPAREDEMQATISPPRGDSAATWDGTYAYVFGGYAHDAGYREVTRYDPGQDRSNAFCPGLPQAMTKHAAVATGPGTGFILGGTTDGGWFLHSVLSYDLACG